MSFEDRMVELFGRDHVVGHHERGHRLVSGTWIDDLHEYETPSFYADDGAPGPFHGGRFRPCNLCKASQPDDGPDACLGYVDGLWVACCGHGELADAYVGIVGGDSIYGFDALEWLRTERGLGPFMDPVARALGERDRAAVDAELAAVPVVEPQRYELTLEPDYGGMHRVTAAIQDYAEQVITAERERLERDLAAAIVLQDTDRLDRLHIVAKDGLDVPVSDMIGWAASSLDGSVNRDVAALQLVQEYERDHGVITDDELADLDKRWLV